LAVLAHWKVQTNGADLMAFAILVGELVKKVGMFGHSVLLEANPVEMAVVDKDKVVALAERLY